MTKAIDRTAGLAPELIEHHLTPAQVFLEEYDFFASLGYTADYIAQRFGMTLAALRKRLERSGRPWPASGDQNSMMTAHAIVARYVADGREFSANVFPFVCDGADTQSALVSALRSGLIVAVGTTTSLMSGRSCHIYRSAAAVAADIERAAA